MPNPICTHCCREMELVESGVLVQYNASAVGGAYQQWFGDLAHCDTCGADVIWRFASRSTWVYDGKTPPQEADIVIQERKGR